MTLVTIYQAEHPETLPVMITEPELVMESELPERLSELNDKTQNINADGTTLSNTTTINTHNFNDMYSNIQSMLPIVGEMVPVGHLMEYLTWLTMLRTF